MAWQSVAQTMKLLASLGDAMNDGGKGNGKGPKGGGKDGGKSGGKGNLKPRLCPWGTCTAAQKKQATCGGGPACFKCKRLFSNSPPIERLVEWAYLEKFQAPKGSPTKGADKAGAKGDGTKGKGKSAPEPQAQSAEQLKGLRATRLEALKAGNPPKQGEAKDGPPASPTATQEVARNWEEKTPESNVAKFKVQDQLAEQTTGLAKMAVEVINSLKSESLPSAKSLPTAEEVFKDLLSGSTPFVTQDGKEAAQAALATTKQAITGFEAVGTARDDTILVALHERAKKDSRRRRPR